MKTVAIFAVFIIFVLVVDTRRTTPAARTTEKVTGTTPIPIPILLTSDSCGLAKVDLVIILDSSTSVGHDNFNKMLQFTKDLLKNSDIDSGSVRVGILSYSTEVTVRFQLKDYRTKSAVFDAIDDIPYTFGSTNTADSIKTMRKEMFTPANGDRSDVKNIAIVITDGVSNINSRRTVPEAEEAKNIDGIHIYAIGIGLSDVTELNQMASVPAKDNSFTVQSFDELVGLDQKIFSALCPETITTRRTTTTVPPTTTTTTVPPTTTTGNANGGTDERDNGDIKRHRHRYGIKRGGENRNIPGSVGKRDDVNRRTDERDNGYQSTPPWQDDVNSRTEETDNSYQSTPPWMDDVNRRTEETDDGYQSTPPWMDDVNRRTDETDNGYQSTPPWQDDVNRRTDETDNGYQSTPP